MSLELLKNDFFLLYPTHINSENKESQGRKYNKTLCISNPRVTEIRKALELLKVEFTFETNKRHPRDTTVGRFTIKRSGPRRETVYALLHKLKEMKEAKTENKSGVENKMKLTVKKKNKNKKR